MNSTNTYLGFTDNMKPMQKARAEKTLDNKKRYNGTVMTNKQFAVNQIIEGSIPEIKDDVCHWSRKLDDYTKPKTEYYIKTKDNSYWTIEKTLYDFAVYLIAKEFTNEATIESFIKYEQEQQEAEQQRLEQERLTQEQEKKDHEEKVNEFQSWVDNQVESYNNSEQLKILKEIFIAEIGDFYNNQIRLLIYIDNIDDSKYGNWCRESLISWLHSGNTTSKKVFYHVTGIKLPVTNKGTYEILDNITKSQYKGIVPYKKRQTHNKDIQTFYRNIRVPVPHFEEVQAEAYNKYGLNMFITNFEDQWQISEVRSGLRIVNGITKKMAFDELKKMIDKHGVEKFQEQINKAIEMYGESPKYKEEVMV